MLDKVSQCFAATLAISDGTQPTFGVAKAAAAPTYCFDVGRLLSLGRRSPESSAVIGTLTSVWDLQNRLQMGAHGDRYILWFTMAEDERYLLGGGPWFYGRSLFVMAEYDGLHDAASVSIDSFPVWVEMLGLPSRLMTNEAAEKVGVTLGHVDQVDKLGIKRGIRSRVKIFHDLKDPVLEAFPSVPFEFGSAKFPVQLQFRYD
ncbi:hypothetical protein ACLB2K_002327 [Fragaria x ananassa]